MRPCSSRWTNHVVWTAKLVTGRRNSRTSQLPESAGLPQPCDCTRTFAASFAPKQSAADSIHTLRPAELTAEPASLPALAGFSLDHVEDGQRLGSWRFDVVQVAAVHWVDLEEVEKGFDELYRRSHIDHVAGSYLDQPTRLIRVDIGIGKEQRPKLDELASEELV